MTQDQYTPGPWVLFRANKCTEQETVRNKKGVFIARVESSTEDDLVGNANAQLIAAAPDLLEALELADALLSGANMNKNVVEKKVKSALKKARGES